MFTSTDYFTNGDSNKKYLERYMSILHLRKKKMLSKKNTENTRHLPKGFTTVSLDESFFFFDSFVRKVWIEENARPVVTVTDSHRDISVCLVRLVWKVNSYSSSMTDLMRTHSMNS